MSARSGGEGERASRIGIDGWRVRLEVYGTEGEGVLLSDQEVRDLLSALSEGGERDASLRRGFRDALIGFENLANPASSLYQRGNAAEYAAGCARELKRACATPAAKGKP